MRIEGIALAVVICRSRDRGGGRRQLSGGCQTSTAAATGRQTKEALSIRDERAATACADTHAGILLEIKL